MTREISVDEFGFQQLLTDRLRLYLGKFRIDRFLEDRFIFFRRLAALLVLPLPLEERRFVYESEDLVEIGDLDNLRSAERSLGDLTSD